MPIGLFSHCHIKAPCGINGIDATLGNVDNPRVFFYPQRVAAENIWFDYGTISYNFPSPTPTQIFQNSISFSFEICSETVYYNNDWPSDITVSINNLEILTFTSEGDFGGRRGNYTPSFWPITSTQYGKLKTISVTREGVFLNGILKHRQITFEDLKLFEGNAIRLTLEVKENAVHRGGMNLFGKNFGDYPQGIIMKIE